MEDFRQQFYDDYIRFKSWQKKVPGDLTKYFSEEIKRLALPKESRLLEVGFGKGEFLDWAKDQGHKTTGIEYIPDLVQEAKDRGHNVIQGSLLQLTQLLGVREGFDLIILFDVLEHLHVNEILTFLRACLEYLNPDGRILIRVPNGLSPFGRTQQFKDVTHVQILTPERMDQMAQLCGLEVSSYYNAIRIARAENKPRFLKILVFWARDLIEVLLGALYFGGRIPLDPNIIIVLRRKSGTKAS